MEGGIHNMILLGIKNNPDSFEFAFHKYIENRLIRPCKFNSRA